jgi:hypothetical protein
MNGWKFMLGRSQKLHEFLHPGKVKILSAEILLVCAAEIHKTVDIIQSLLVFLVMAVIHKRHFTSTVQ